MRRTLLLVIPLLAFTACARSDKERAQQDLRRSGDAVKKELKNDAAFMKKQALQARDETEKGLKEFKAKVNQKVDEEKAKHDSR